MSVELMDLDFLQYHVLHYDVYMLRVLFLRKVDDENYITELTPLISCKHT